jgi:gliding motility-associated-like protein
VTTLYTVTMTDSCGNSISDDVQVETYYPPVPDFTFNSNNWCEPAIVLFTNTTQNVSGQITGYSWNLGNGELSNQINPATVYFEDGVYTVTLTATNSFGCVDSVSKSVTVRPRPDAAFYFEPANPSVNTPLVTFVDNSSEDATGWLWQIQSLYSSSEQNTQYSFTVPGEYDVTLYIVNQFGCTDTAYGTVVVTGISTIFVPTAFTPQGDFLNETFMPLMTNMKAFEMRIFNRWGELLFSTQNQDGPGWDGSNRAGKMMKNDVYVYKIYVKDIYGLEYEYYGHFTLLSDER